MKRTLRTEKSLSYKQPLGLKRAPTKKKKDLSRDDRSLTKKKSYQGRTDQGDESNAETNKTVRREGNQAQLFFWGRQEKSRGGAFKRKYYPESPG